MKQRGFIFLLLLILLSSCTSAQQISQSEEIETASPSKTPEATNTYTPEPTTTHTPTLAPTPMGGKKLRVAYLSRDCEAINTKNCIVISDFFAETVLYRIPLSDTTIGTYLLWSPDGRYLLYEDRDDNLGKYNVMLYDFVLTQSTELKKYYALAAADWSTDLKYVAYKAYNSQYENKELNIYNLETGENKVVDGFVTSYYWLDDQKSLAEIKTGSLYDVESDELITVPNAYFMNVNTIYDEYIISYKGDDPSKPDEIYFYPYVKDRDIITEKGTAVIYDDEFLFAKLDYDKKSRMPHITINSLFIQGDTVTFSGYTYFYEPYEMNRYEYTGSMSDVPFIITDKNYISTNTHDLSRTILISPDEKLYFTEQFFYLGKDKGHQSYITVNDMETGEELDTFDFHALGKEMYDIDYLDRMNLAFYWEEE
jgi:hypothetical protein